MPLHRIVSDLHFEFHADRGVTLTREIANGDFDILILAGDLTSFAGLADALGLVCSAVAPRPVLYVLGNHEYYGGSLEAVNAVLKALSRDLPNLVYLERGVAELLGQRYVGGTLWFPHSPDEEPLDRAMPDFQEIEKLRTWVPRAAIETQQFLEDNVRAGDVVVTHHLPHPSSIAPEYRGSPLNRYFLHDLSHIVEGRGAALWAHGHTHASADYVAGRTRVVCNPFGYVPDGLNPRFSSELDVRVGPG